MTLKLNALNPSPFPVVFKINELKDPINDHQLFAAIFDLRRLDTLTGVWPIDISHIPLVSMDVRCCSEEDVHHALERANQLLRPHDTELVYYSTQAGENVEWKIWLQRITTPMPISSEEIMALLENPPRYAVLRN